LGALQKMCEDSAERFTAQEVNQLLGPCIMFFQSSSPKLRGLSLNSVNSIILMQNDAIGSHIDQFLANLFALGQDTDSEVQKQLCRALTLLLESHIEQIAPQLSEIAEFMLLKTQDQQIDTALEACEFWLAFAECPELCKKYVEPLLPRLFTVLLKCMKYTPEEIAEMKGDVEDDANVPDKDEDIKPRFHKSKTHGGKIESERDLNSTDDEVGLLP
jgi:transportin-1